MALVKRRILGISFTAVLFVNLAACSAPQASPPESVAPEPTVSSTPAEAEIPEAFPFVLPTNCTELLGAELESEILATGDVLLMGPNGAGADRNEEYLGYQEVGTPMFCLYGESRYDDLIEFDVQALTPDTYAAALTALEAREFIETREGDVVTFSLLGAKGLTEAVVQALHPDGWITVHRLDGGTRKFEEMTDWLEIVTAQVFPEP